MKKYCIVNPSIASVNKILADYGYICIATIKSPNVSAPISLHADVLYLKTEDNRLFVSDCQLENINLLKQLGTAVYTVKLSPGYMTECKLNMVVTDNDIICNTDTCIDTSEFENNKDIITVKQGYTKCSTIAVKNSFITEDRGIYNALIKANKNCLLIEKGHVKLEGYNYGFIGGASVYLTENNILLFFGNIANHPDYQKIIDFCNTINVSVKYIEELELTDIGGAVVV